jgi:hypothetical protein
MKRVLIAAALLAVSGLPALAKTSSDMDCAHYDAMGAAGQMAVVESMRSSMSAAHKMYSSKVVAKKVGASCKDHPSMMVHEAMKNAMPH